MKFYKTNDPGGYMSNYWKARFFIYGRWWSTVEHAYQAAKFDKIEDKEYISKLRTPSEAKAYGKGKAPKAWRTVSLHIMLNLVRAKFQNHKELKEELISTGDRELIEGNWWNDTFWGECPLGVGENHLGHILMEVRKELQDESRAVLDNAERHTESQSG